MASEPTEGPWTVPDLKGDRVITAGAEGVVVTVALAPGQSMTVPACSAVGLEQTSPPRLRRDHGVLTLDIDGPPIPASELDHREPSHDPPR